MRKYTKLCLATFCFIASASAMAGGYKGEAPPLVPVSIPMFNGGFEFTVGAIYMTPESTNTNYLGTQQNIGFSSGGNVIDNYIDYAVDPNYNWGFILGLGYVIPGTANDVKLDWTYFHNDYKSSEYILGSQSSPTNSILFPTGGVALSSPNELNATGKVDYSFDAVDLTFGQYLNFGSRLQTRLFTGLRYMRLDSDLTTAYTGNGYSGTSQPFTFDEVLNWSGEVDSSFNGLGPLVGIKADYYLGQGFSLSGGIDGALLVGQLSLDGSSGFSRQTLSGSTWSTTRVDSNTLDWDSQNIIAPGWDAKFGIDYKYRFNNGTLLGLELGYQVTQYIDVVAQLDRDSASEQGFADPLRFDTDVTDFRLAGPYLTVNVKV